MNIGSENSPERGPSPYRILALDGGGIRGYYTAKLLAGLLTHFEKSTGRDNLDLGKGFDMIAGTSTGGILAAALAFGKRPGDIAALYKDKGPRIFPEPFPKIGMDLASAFWAFRHRNRPTASKANLSASLEPVFGTTTLEDVWNRRRIALTIPAVSVESYGPKIFKTPHLHNLTHDRPIKLTDVCQATGAAPFYFPLHRIGVDAGYYRDDLFVDGGLWANNPSLVALIEALAILNASGEKRPIHIFSLGTCAGPVDQSHLRDDPAGGLVTWSYGKDLMELAISTSASAMNEMTKLLADSLSTPDRPIIYARIPDPEMTSQDQSCLSLDKADERAFEVMNRMAAKNESRILSSMGTPHDAVHRSLKELMSSLPTQKD